jgi:hypothetical protein
MSKRNIILLIVTLSVIVAGALIYFYFYQPKNQGSSTTGDTNFLANFLPFGKSKTVTPTETTKPVDISGYVPPAPETATETLLKKVSSFPIAGFGVFTKERFKDVPLDQTASTSTTSTEFVTTDSGPLPVTKKKVVVKPTTPPTEFVTALRYVAKDTGNVYETFADKIDESKFSSTVIPKVYEAYFGNNGESVIMRYLKDDNTIETFIGTLPKEYLGADDSSSNEIKGSFLPENITDLSMSPDNSKFFYLFNNVDNAIGTTYLLNNNSKIQVFDSPFTEWLSSWTNNQMITLTTKPSANVPGYMYFVNPDNKDFNKILGGINGLTTLTSPDGKLVLYADNNLSLNIFDITKDTSYPLNIRTLPEKCVWTKTSDIVYCAVPNSIDDANYPDAWYQGQISFSDQIWQINVTNGNTSMLADPVSIAGEEIDGIKLTLDSNENYLFFVNKKDSFLWELIL